MSSKVVKVIPQTLNEIPSALKSVGESCVDIDLVDRKDVQALVMRYIIYENRVEYDNIVKNFGWDKHETKLRELNAIMWLLMKMFNITDTMLEEFKKDIGLEK